MIVIKTITNTAMLAMVMMVLLHAEWTLAADVPSPSPMDVAPAMHSSLRQVLDSHPSIRAKRAEVQVQLGGLGAAKWQYFPEPSISHEQHGGQRTTLAVQQPLWTGGRLTANQTYAQCKVHLAQQAVLEAQWQVAQQLLDAWQTVISGYAQTQAAQAGLERLGTLSGMIDRRVAQAVSPAIDQALMQARISQAQTDVMLAQNTWRNAQSHWQHYTGATQTIDEQTLNPLLQEALKPIAPNNEATITAPTMRDWQTHPSMLRNASQTALAQAEVEQRKAQVWPNVYARLSRQYMDAQTARQTGSPTADTQWRIGFEYTPGAGLAQASLIQSSIDQLQVLQQEREQIRRDLADQLQTQWQNHASNALRLEQVQKAVQNAQEVQAAYVRLFTVGRRNWLDVLNAVRELNQAELLLAQLQAQQVISRYRLMLSLTPWFDNLIVKPS